MAMRYCPMCNKTTNLNVYTENIIKDDMDLGPGTRLIAGIITCGTTELLRRIVKECDQCGYRH